MILIPHPRIGKGVPRCSAGLTIEWMKSNATITEQGCWIWRGGKTVAGYGVTTNSGKRCLTHRAAYELTRGSIASGLVIDHLCRTTSCFNPDHLEPVTPRENVIRGASLKFHGNVCPRCQSSDLRACAGGGRNCAPCTRARRREYMAHWRSTPAGREQNRLNSAKFHEKKKARGAA